MTKHIPLALFLFALTALLARWLVAPAHAQGVITVTNTTAFGCTLPDAVEAANSDSAVGLCPAGSGEDTIRFAASFNPGTFMLSQELVIESAIIIDGEGRITLDGDDDTRLIQVTSNGELTLGGITLQNGSSISNGGAIYNAGELLIINSTLFNNAAFAGGAIYNESNATLNMLTSTVSSNSAESRGGAIVVSPLSTATIAGGIFAANSAGAVGGILDEPGGAIDNRGTLVMNAVTLRANTSSRGGAIASNGVNPSVSIENSLFELNSAETTGGAIDNGIGTVTVTNTTFSTNSATTDGGALFNDQNGHLSLTSSTFDSNGNAISSSATFSMTDSYLTDNNIAINNDGIASIQFSSLTGNFRAIDNDGTLYLMDSVLSQNGPTQGSALWNKGTAHMLHTTIRNNAAVFVGVVYNQGDMLLVNSTFASNTADRASGLFNIGTFLTGSSYNTFVYNESAIGGAGDWSSLSYSLFALNTAPNQNDNCSSFDGALSLNSSNMADDLSCGFAQVSPNIAIGLYGDNGCVTPVRTGPTTTGCATTVAIMAGSDAIDAASATPPMLTDQRGYTRVAGSSADIGAYEHAAIPTAITLASSVQSTAVHSPFGWLALLLLVSTALVVVVTGGRLSAETSTQNQQRK